jgi:hypothetical protein
MTYVDLLSFRAMNKYSVHKKSLARAQKALGHRFPITSHLVKACVETMNACLISLNIRDQDMRRVAAGHIPDLREPRVNITIRMDEDFTHQLKDLESALRVTGSRCIGSALGFCATRPERISFAKWFKIGLGLKLQGDEPVPLQLGKHKTFEPDPSRNYLFLVDSMVLLYSLLREPDSITESCRAILRRSIVLGPVQVLTPDCDRLCKAITRRLKGQKSVLRRLNTPLREMMQITPPPMEVYDLASSISTRIKKDADAYLVCAYALSQPKDITPVIVTMDQQYLHCAAKHGLSVWTPWECKPVYSRETTVLRDPETGKAGTRVTLNTANPDVLKMETD